MSHMPGGSCTSRCSTGVPAYSAITASSVRSTLKALMTSSAGPGVDDVPHLGCAAYDDPVVVQHVAELPPDKGALAETPRWNSGLGLSVPSWNSAITQTFASSSGPVAWGSM